MKRLFFCFLGGPVSQISPLLFDAATLRSQAIPAFQTPFGLNILKTPGSAALRIKRHIVCPI
jgi:hypothetical protein